MKLSPVRQVVKGKRVVMVDDSIVRGTTSKRIVKMLKEAGATEVHVVIASPPLVSPCFYGVDISTDSELIATNRSIEEIRELIEADSLTFLSPEGMLESIGRPDTYEKLWTMSCMLHRRISDRYLCGYGNAARKRNR